MSQQNNKQNKTSTLEALKKLYSLAASNGAFSSYKNEVAEALTKVNSVFESQRELNRAINKRKEADRETEKPDTQPAAATPTSEGVASAIPHSQASQTTAHAEQKPAPQSEPKIRTQVFDTNTTVRRPSYVRGIANIPINQPRPKKPAPRIQSGAPGQTGAAGRPRNPLERQPYDRNSPRPQSARPNSGFVRTSAASITAAASASLSGVKSRKTDVKKKEPVKTGAFDDKKSMNKRTLIRKGFIQEDFDEDRIRIRKLKNKKRVDQSAFEPKRIESVVLTSAQITIKALSEMMGVSALEIMKKMMLMGGTAVKSINDFVDYDTLFVVAEEFDVELILKLEQTKEELAEALHEDNDTDESLEARPPVVAVMGHVDHGKTSLLDAIKNTNVAIGEAGGITQHIGAYTVNWEYEKKKKSITFLDTPGHEAFAEMRARGAKVTDIVVLVVAADDGVQPQTIEAISHVKAANVPLIVAINKIDKPDANPEKIKQELSNYGVLTSEWGGDVNMVSISAKKNIGIDNLLQEILFLAELNAYKANPNRKAKGTIIEARLDRGKGPVVTIIVQNGTMRLGDAVVTGKTYGKIRAMTDAQGRNVKEALPSMPVSVLGLSEVPNSGDPILVVDDEKMARQIVGERGDKTRNDMLDSMATSSLDDALRSQQSEQKALNLIIKADVQGSSEALRNALAKKMNEEVRVSIVHSGVGMMNKSDMMLAEVTKAIVIGFNVKPDNEARIIAESSGIRIVTSNIIYSIIDEIDAVMNGMVEPKYRDVIIGRAQIRNVFKITNVGTVAGSYVLDGKIQRNAKANIYRGKEIIHRGTISGLKHFKDDVKEMAAGFECGIFIDGYSDFVENDEIEAYVQERIN